MGVYAKAGSASRARTLRATLGGVAILGASALVLAGCAGGGESGGTSTEGGAAGDLSLKIGTILPQTGTLAVLGPPEIAGVDLAVADINEAAAGISIDVEQKDSGDTSTDFTTYEDDGYYWRTAPSDVLQGRILGNKILGDGKTNVSILYMNDAYGTGLESNIKETLEAGGATVAAEEIFEPASTDFNSALTTVLAPNPDALVVISFDEIKTIAEQLAAKGFDFSKLYGTDGNYGVIGEADTNVDIAGAQFTNPGVQASDDFQSKLQALVTEQGNDELTVFSYAPESYDATVLLALAALQGGATDGATIRDNLETVSKDGTECTTFADCAALVADGTDIDYNGLSGPISFDENGDPSEASVSIYKYDTGNVTSFEETVDGSLE